jgi:hypothetical protein
MGLFLLLVFGVWTGLLGEEEDKRCTLICVDGRADFVFFSSSF